MCTLILQLGGMGHGAGADTVGIVKEPISTLRASCGIVKDLPSVLCSGDMSGIVKEICAWFCKEDEPGIVY